MRFYLLAICLTLSAVSGFSQTPTSAQNLTSLGDARKLADKAVGFFKEEKFAEGYEVLKPHWPLAAVEIDSLTNQTSTQWPLVKQRYGASLATEFIRERKAGDSFVQYVYLQKFERHAVRWTFVFYKPGAHWLVNGVSFDDSVSLLFE